MYCQSCGNETPDQAIYCLHCGVRVNKECPRCAEIVKAKAKMCRFCRYEFSPEEIAELERLEQERRLRQEAKRERREKKEEHGRVEAERERRQQEYAHWHPPERVGAWGHTVLECPRCSTLNSRNLESCRRCSGSLRTAPQVKNPYS